jgi:hypothetical protein
MGKRRDTHNFVLGMAAGQQAKSNNSSQRPKMHFPLNLWSIFFQKGRAVLKWLQAYRWWQPHIYIIKPQKRAIGSCTLTGILIDFMQTSYPEIG